MKYLVSTLLIIFSANWMFGQVTTKVTGIPNPSALLVENDTLYFGSFTQGQIFYKDIIIHRLLLGLLKLQVIWKDRLGFKN